MAANEVVMTFREHLVELRKCLVRIALLLVVGFAIGWEFRKEIFAFLSGPITEALADNGIYHYQAISITESIVVYLKSVLIAAITVGSPLIFYQFWSFVGPGLLKKEKDLMVPVTVFSVIFFLIGSAFAYQIIVPFVTDWLVQMTLEDGGVEMFVTMQNAYSTAFTFLLMFGLVFELPLIIYFLALFGAVTPRSLIKFFRYFVVLSFIIAAILTPPDPISQALMAVPLNLLYAFGIAVAWAVERARARVEAQGDDVADEDRKRVGAESMRMFGAGLVLLMVAGGLVVGFIQLLPSKYLHTLVPATTSWGVGYNPQTLKSNDPVDALLGGTLGNVSPSAAMAILEGGEAEPIKRVFVIEVKGGQRAALVRGDGIGLNVQAFHARLMASVSKDKMLDLGVTALDESTVAFGARAIVHELASIKAGDVTAYQAGELEARLVNRLRVSGPLWAWLPNPGSGSKALLGDALGDGIAAVGGVINRLDEPMVTLEVRALSSLQADNTEGQLEAERIVAQQRRQRSKQSALLEAVKVMARQMKQVSSPARRQQLADVMQKLSGLAEEPQSGPIPVMRQLSRVIRGWSIRRKDEWLAVSAELTPPGLKGFWSRVLSTPPRD